jgi:hypothetical protein
MTTIWCDVEGCDARIDVPAELLGDARRMAKDAGWKSAGAYDVCPIGWRWDHEVEQELQAKGLF